MRLRDDAERRRAAWRELTSWRAGSFNLTRVWAGYRWLARDGRMRRRGVARAMMTLADLNNSMDPQPAQAESEVPAAPRKKKSLLRRVASVVLMAAIFGWMGTRIRKHWDDISGHVHDIRWTRFFIAALLFAVFLFAFRALVWRRILKRFGYRLPIAPAARIWSTSEMARYIPGAIMQVAGRVYLVKPYGVPGSVCAASQMLELITFLVANLLLGFSCLVVFGARHLSGQAKGWVYILALLLPLLALLLHPKIFYSLVNRVMARLKKPALTSRLSGWELSRLLVWNILGLLVQSVAVFLIVADPLKLHWDKWYVVTGAYSLAWCAGFLAVLNPAGLGVREAVFVGIMLFALPKEVQHQFANKQALKGFLMFLGGLLRLWTIAGELILSGITHAIDHQGAIGRVEMDSSESAPPALAGRASARL